MLCVETKVLPSKIDGLGLFADEFISKGKIIWRFTHCFDLKFTKEHLKELPECTFDFLQKYMHNLKYTKEQINEFPEHTLDFFKKYAYLSKRSGLYILCTDNTLYFNHSETPNSLDKDYKNEEEGVSIAASDIQKGEEITENYESFDKEFESYISSFSLAKQV